MSLAYKRFIGVIASFALMAMPDAHADLVNYTLDNVILDDGTQMTGTFSWTFAAGDFGNGAGQWSSLAIPWTLHDQNDLNSTFDVGSSIEITLPGNLHDDGVDITLFLLQPLTPTTLSLIDLTRSKYDIGGNGFHAGAFLGGSVAPAAAVPEPSAFALVLWGVALLWMMTRIWRSQILGRPAGSGAWASNVIVVRREPDSPTSRRRLR